MTTYGIIEAGSTFTKSYLAFDTTVEQVGMRDIPFREHFRANGAISEADVSELVGAARILSAAADSVHVFGTSAFREAPQEQIEQVRHAALEQGATFEVVSAEQEGEYTARGAMRDLSYPGSVAVMVGGGGSTEVFVFAHGTVVEKALSPVGVGDVNHAFPDLCDEVSSTEPRAVTEWIRGRLSPVSSSADLLVLAGGNFPLLYLNAGYHVVANEYAAGPNAPYMLNNADKNARDIHYFHELRLGDFRELTPDTPAWWDGTRAMCCFVAAVAQQVDAHTLIPTSISMVYGLVESLQNRERDSAS